MDIEIATYWNVETLYYVFNAIAAVMGGAGFEGLLKMVFVFGIMIGIFAYNGNQQLELAKWFINALVFVTLLNLPIARVIITDKTDLEPPRVVDHVPFALAVVAQASNLTFGYLTSSYETVFGVPEALGLQKGDVGFGHRILKQVNNATVRDPALRADLMQFIKECTLYDVKDGVITPQQIVGGTDTWNVIFSNTSPARFVTYDSLSSSPVTVTCEAAALVLKDRVNDAVTAAQTFYGKQAFTRASTDAVATSMFVSSVGTSYDWILNNSSNASDAMRQSMFNNIWKEAGTELPTLLNDPARVAEISALASSAQAARQADGSNSTLSLLAQETLPHMRNWIEAIIYALFPVVVVLMVVMSTESAKKVFIGYVTSLAWIGLWPLLFAIINHLSLMHLRYKARALELAAGVPFQMSDAFDATLSNEQSMIGYMVVLVPFIAGAIVKMGQGGLTSLGDKMIGSFQSAGAAAGSQTASGNYSMGQTGMDTRSVNSTSMNKYDSNIGLSGGGATIARPDGSTATMAAGGTVALQQMRNQMLTQMGMDHKFEASSNREAQSTQSLSTGHQLVDRHTDATSYSDVKGYDRTKGDMQQTGVRVGTASQGGYGGQHATGQTLDQSNRETSHFRMAAGNTDNLNMSLGINSGGGGGAGGGGGGAVDPKEEKRIADSMKEGGASQQKIDEALRNYRESNGGGSRGGGFFSGGLGIQGQKTFSAEHSRDRAVDTSHGSQESARTDRHYSETGSTAVEGSTGSQSQQQSRHARDATLSNADDRSQVNDVSERTDRSVSDRVNRSESNSFSVHKDLMSDPQLLEKVAKRNGMSAMRFSNQNPDRIMSMVQDYVGEKGVLKTATALPQKTLGGKALPTSEAELNLHAQTERNVMPNTISQAHKANAAKTGYKGTAAVKVDTQTPPIVASAKAEVDGQLDSRNNASITSRAAAMDDNVRAWASPDKKVGEGRANPAAVTEDMAIRDVKDTAEKVWDKLTGGDGTADGEKLTENMKRETAADVRVDGGGGRKK